MNYRYRVIDIQGRLWIQTLTKLKALKIIKMLKETKGVIAVVEKIKNNP